MSTGARARIEEAFRKLAARPGFSRRADQRQLADLLSDCIESSQSGAFEAPTGLGKSLACLIPAIAYALEGKKTVIATYTNVLAEQYWHKDLPFALSLFDEPPPTHELLMGKSRYACKIALDDIPSNSATRYALERFAREAKLGIETEFRETSGLSAKNLRLIWPKATVPPVCSGRLCPLHEDCFYYGARRRAEKAMLVITNHAVVLQNALLSDSTDDERSLYGKLDMLILDEAHDFISAAQSSLEIEISEQKLNVIRAMATRFSQSLTRLAERTSDHLNWLRQERDFAGQMDQAQELLHRISLARSQPGILQINPDDLKENPTVKAFQAPEVMDQSHALSDLAADSVQSLLSSAEKLIDQWTERELFASERMRELRESTRNYVQYLSEFVIQCRQLSIPQNESVTYLQTMRVPAVRQEPIVFREILRELIFNKTPTIALSATLSVDGQFDFFCSGTGFEPNFSEILPSPFDFSTQAAVYLPPTGAIPDPTLARREGTEENYYQQLTQQIQEIIVAAQGRCLVLFHSRKEMNAVYERIALPPNLTLHVQTGSAAGVGDRFREEISSSLFAVRSFWTGFDAPGETLSVVVLVRVPFEVPTDPPQVARQAYLRQLGLDPFQVQTLPAAKMMIRQGVGRLIRTTSDKGIIALLDPRLMTKRYGEEILDNLPKGMRTFRDIYDAIGWVGLETES